MEKEGFMRKRRNLLSGMVAGVLCLAVIAGVADAQKKKGVIKFGVLPLQQPEMMQKRFSRLAEYLSKETGYTFELVVYPTTSKSAGYNEAVIGLVSGETPFAYLAPVTIVQARHNDELIEPVVSASRDGAPSYTGHIAVRKDSAIKKVQDLKGKKVIGASSSSTSGNLMPSAYLLKIGMDKKDFAAMDFAGGHDKAAQAVLSGAYDACWINDESFQKIKDKDAGLRTIWVHDPVPEFPICVNNRYVDPALLSAVKKALLKMHQVDLPGLQAIDPKYEKWVVMKWKDFISTKETLDRVRGKAFYDLNS